MLFWLDNTDFLFSRTRRFLFLRHIVCMFAIFLHPLKIVRFDYVSVLSSIDSFIANKRKIGRLAVLLHRWGTRNGTINVGARARENTFTEKGQNKSEYFCKQVNQCEWLCIRFFVCLLVARDESTASHIFPSIAVSQQ